MLTLSASCCKGAVWNHFISLASFKRILYCSSAVKLWKCFFKLAVGRQHDCIQCSIGAETWSCLDVLHKLINHLLD